VDFLQHLGVRQLRVGGERRKPANALDSSADLSVEFRKRCAGMLESRKLRRAAREENS
jgi:hypothetical protein